MRSAIYSIILFSLLLSGCRSKPGGEDAITHFHEHHRAIEELAAYYLRHPGIDYIEFKPGGLVDIWVLDKTFDRASSPAVFKHQLWAQRVDSEAVNDALEYAAISRDVFSRMRELALDAGCISLATPFWESSPVELDVGYRRTGMSKWIFRRYHPITKIADLTSRPPWKNEHNALLKDQWTLVFGRGAFN